MPKISKEFVDTVQPTERDLVYWDDAIPGFGLRVKPAGSKSYLIQFRDKSKGGQSKRMTIGQAHRITATEARSEARRLHAKNELRLSPSDEREAHRKAMTLADLTTEYFKAATAGEILTRRGQGKAASTLAVDLGRATHHILPSLGNKPVREITRQDVDRLLRAVKSGATRKQEASTRARGRIVVTGGAGTAKKAVTLLSAIMAFAIERGLIDANPTKGVRLPADGKRTLSDPEGLLRALGVALRIARETGENPNAVSAIELAALTGLRRQEVLGLTWRQVDFDRRAIRLPSSKTGASIRPLARAAANLLERLRSVQANPRPEDFVFPADRKEHSAYGGLPKAIERIVSLPDLSEAQRDALMEFSMHALRHTFASVANLLGATEVTIAGLLGHAQGSVTQGYIARVDKHLLGVADDTARRIFSLLCADAYRDEEPFSEVVQLRADAGR
ncbi:tyrosine-type recombinase/integrase [Tabrizicola sp.]|uniref:tyrosine-type recombinase/integrase n=1 Tax=Tabrizicola sp. TaxID=2005166 RepID=UPI00262DF2B1|nr:tyrosine-type recombinase/integrase [Tabrizicola sp.]MDM7930729.1 tyrosine-type recombinase/integrase [Tabrizicola sp.]